MTIKELKEKIFRAIKSNKESIVLNETIDERTVELLEYDYDDLHGFIIRCFKDYERGLNEK